MNKLLRQSFEKLAFVALFVISMLSGFAQTSIDAAELVQRSIYLTDSQVGVSTTHTLSFNYASVDDVGSIGIEYCSNGPLFETSCTPSAGLSVLGASIANQTNETGFSIHGNTTANRLVLTRPAEAVTPGAATYTFDSVMNPSDYGSHYVRIQTYGSTDGTGAHIDRGGLAYSITEPIDVSAQVPPLLAFCVGVTISSNTNCNTASGNDIDFGTFTSAAPSFGTTQMLAATNGPGGYAITISGTTMTSGNNTIAANSSQETSQTGTAQFGLNLVDNSNPDTGSNVAGAGTGVVTNTYNDANQFKFANGDVVARSTLPTEYNRFTTSYVVNIPQNQPAGVYSTTITYIATASF